MIRPRKVFTNRLPTLLSSIIVIWQPEFIQIFKSWLQIVLLDSAVPGMLPGPLLIGQDIDS